MKFNRTKAYNYIQDLLQGQNLARSQCLRNKIVFATMGFLMDRGWENCEQRVRLRKHGRVRVWFSCPSNTANEESVSHSRHERLFKWMSDVMLCVCYVAETGIPFTHAWMFPRTLSSLQTAHDGVWGIPADKQTAQCLNVSCQFKPYQLRIQIWPTLFSFL